MMRQAMTRWMAMDLLRRSALLWAAFSIRHPDFNTRCQSSIRQRRQYQRRHLWASSADSIFIVVSKYHSMPSSPSGGLSSSTCTTHRTIGGLSLW